MKCLLVFTALLIACGRAVAIGVLIPLYSMTYLDYVGSEPLTSAAIYPAQYDALEVPNGVPGVAWVRTAGSRTLRIALFNPTLVAHSTKLELSNFVY